MEVEHSEKLFPEFRDKLLTVVSDGLSEGRSRRTIQRGELQRTPQ